MEGGREGGKKERRKEKERRREGGPQSRKLANARRATSDDSYDDETMAVTGFVFYRVAAGGHDPAQQNGRHQEFLWRGSSRIRS